MYFKYLTELVRRKQIKRCRFWVFLFFGENIRKFIVVPPCLQIMFLRYAIHNFTHRICGKNEVFVQSRRMIGRRIDHYSRAAVSCLHVFRVGFTSAKRGDPRQPFPAIGCYD